MNLHTISKVNAKPFLKWAGGKTQLLQTLDYFLPESFRREKNITYIEPFVGGGAMLFFMLQKYPNIKKAIINDINSHLVKTYTIIRDNPYSLIDSLFELQEKFKTADSFEAEKELFLNIRSRFNQPILTDIEEATYMIFLNRTCFNGLYRENSKDDFKIV